MPIEETETKQEPQTGTREQNIAPDEGTDWKEKARLWEARAKRNHKRVSELEAEIKTLGDSQAEAVKEAVKPLQAKLKDFEHRDQVRQWKTQVAEDTGVPADILRGENLEDIKAHAQSIKTHLDAATGPVVPNVGEVPQREVSSSLQVIRSLFGTK